MPVITTKNASAVPHPNGLPQRPLRRCDETSGRSALSPGKRIPAVLAIALAMSASFAFWPLPAMALEIDPLNQSDISTSEQQRTATSPEDTLSEGAENEAPSRSNDPEFPTLAEPDSGDLDTLYPDDRDYWVDLGTPAGESARWYVYRNGSLRKGCWVEFDGAWYHLSENGEMQTGWMREGDTWYFLEPSGAMRLGWYFDGGYWYWFEPTGAMRTGWRCVNGSWFFFDPDNGHMITGWARIDGEIYFFTPSGEMRVGWLSYNGEWYYFTSSGHVLCNDWVGPYYLGSDGTMLASRVTPDGSWVGADGIRVPNEQVNRILGEIASTALSFASDGERLSFVAESVAAFASNATYGMDAARTYRTPTGLIANRQYTCAGTAATCKHLLNLMGYAAVHTNQNQMRHQWAETTIGETTWIVEGMVGFAARKQDAPNYPSMGRVVTARGEEMWVAGAV